MSERQAADGGRRYRFYLIVGAGCVLILYLLVSMVRRERASMEVGPMGEIRAARQMASARGGYSGAGGAGGGGGGGGMAMRPSSIPAAADEGAQSTGFEPKASTSAWPVAPMLIRTAGLRLRVEEVAKAHAQIAGIARAAGGYVANSTLSAESGPASANIAIRVPNEGMDSAIDQIAALGTLLSKEMSAQEVTEEYTDLNSRRRNLQREELRLLDLLERAGKIRDLLEVEQEIGRVRGEIETISGRLRYLGNRVALSTIHVQLNGPEPKPTSGGPVWTARDVTRQATRSLLRTGRNLATHAIWIGVYTPIWLPLALVGLWVGRRAMRVLPKP